jgi:ATP-binding cassette subfamily F protein 2
MEAVVWLEQYLSKFKKILLIISHSQVRGCCPFTQPHCTAEPTCALTRRRLSLQDFMNNVCTNILHMTSKRVDEFGGNYDTVRALLPLQQLTR